MQRNSDRLAQDRPVRRAVEHNRNQLANKGYGGSMRSRRVVLQAALVAPFVAACAPGLLLGNPGSVRIAVSWSGLELTAFNAVLAGLRFPHPVEVVPLGDEIGTAFTADGRSAPDIVMLPHAGRVRELAERRRVRPVAEKLWHDEHGARYPETWRRLAYHQGKPYAVPFKAAAKSLVWYDRESVAEHDLGDPASWTLPQWRDRMTALAGSGRRLLALGAADGWVLTDMFENVLLAESPPEYEAMGQAQGERDWDRDGVRAAFARSGELWSHPDALAGGVGPALTRQFPDAVREVFQHRRAVMVAAPDFAEPVVRDGLRLAGRGDDVVGVVPFPAVERGVPGPRILGGDVMVLTESAGPRADALVAALAAPQAPLPWMRRYGGFLGPNLRTRGEYSSWLAPLAAEQGSGEIFDLSDRLGAVGGRDGLWRVLTDFLIEVGAQVCDVGAASERAVAALNRFERRQR